MVLQMAVVYSLYLVRCGGACHSQSVSWRVRQCRKQPRNTHQETTTHHAPGTTFEAVLASLLK